MICEPSAPALMEHNDYSLLSVSLIISLQAQIYILTELICCCGV